ncbi:MAG: hypothetical protein M1835_002255 [Candelina submexicana]|nr:MAG: hypothetical protein M1835_002255 [Candelina submexicana]
MNSEKNIFALGRNEAGYVQKIPAVAFFAGDNAGGAETAKKLCEEVDGESSPRKPAVEAAGECYGWVEVGPGVASHVNS